MSDPDSLQLVQNGKNTFSATDLETFKTNGVVNLNLNLHVFACHLSNKATWFSKGRLYELKIWKKNAESGEFALVRHYLPCIKGGRAALYDKVEGKIYYSFNDDNFVAGPVLDKPLDFVEWISTDGYQSVAVSADGGAPVELHKDGRACLAGENVVTNTLALMACHQDDAYTCPSSGLLYRATIWDGDELLRDFVPVVATFSADGTTATIPVPSSDGFFLRACIGTSAP